MAKYSFEFKKKIVQEYLNGNGGYMYLAKKYMSDEKLLKRLEEHDLDKMYLLLFYRKKDIEGIHRELSRHHDNDIEKDYLDYVEMVLDWESARYTKPDKPLNAYDTLYRFYPQLEKKILPILEKFEIAKSNMSFDQDTMNYANLLKDVTMDEIKKELINFIKKC